MSNNEHFSNRWGIVLAALGMAIGAGNLWRFPRLAGQYGGSFILLWILFLIVWSIPILFAEFSIGKKFKKGVIGSFAKMAGRQYSFMGFFITVCTLGIAFYYTIVTAWALRYFGFSLRYALGGKTIKGSLNYRLGEEPEFLENFWMSVSNGSPLTISLYILIAVVGVYILNRGITNGLERANRVLIPTLFAMLILIIIYSLSLDGGIRGLQYMYQVNPADFSDPRIWIEAITQSAWSTGAGWGLMMTISSYSRSDEDVTLNTVIGAFGNNTASLLSGMAILPAVFAVAASEQDAIAFLQSGSQALTFMVIPQLFSTISGGMILASLFFLALFLAAFSSLLPMIELLMSNIIDLGITRRRAALIALIMFIVFGFPNAFSLDYFTNQDWVWGVGLLLSGLFVIIGSVRFGLLKMKHDMIDLDSDLRISDHYFRFCMLFNLPAAVFLIYWWMSQGYSEYPWFDENGHWNVLDVYSNASIITQWGAVVLIGIFLNSWLYKNFAK